jgi:hypothetical protein
MAAVAKEAVVGNQDRPRKTKENLRLADQTSLINQICRLVTKAARIAVHRLFRDHQL